VIEDDRVVDRGRFVILERHARASTVLVFIEFTTRMDVEDRRRGRVPLVTHQPPRLSDVRASLQLETRLANRERGMFLRWRHIFDRHIVHESIVQTQTPVRVTVEIVENVSLDDLVHASAVAKIDTASFEVTQVEFDRRRFVILLPKDGRKVLKKVNRRHGWYLVFHLDTSLRQRA